MARKSRKARIEHGAKRVNGRSKITLAAMPSEWDKGAMGQANQDGLRTEPATDIDPETGREAPNPNGVKRRRRDDWLMRYLRADHLTAQQVAAGLKLRFAAEGMRERDPLARIEEIRAVGEGDPLAAYVDGRRQFRALWALVPQDCRPVVERVALDDLPIWSGGGMIARDRHMMRLCRGLDAIA